MLIKSKLISQKFYPSSQQGSTKELSKDVTYDLFFVLSTEIIAHIFQYIKDNDLKHNVLFTSKLFFNIVNEYHLDNVYARGLKFSCWQRDAIRRLRLDVSKFSYEQKVGIFNRPDINYFNKIKYYFLLAIVFITPVIMLYIIYCLIINSNKNIFQDRMSYQNEDINHLFILPSAHNRRKIVISPMQSHTGILRRKIQRGEDFLSCIAIILIGIAAAYFPGWVASYLNRTIRILNHRYKSLPITRQLLGQLKEMISYHKLFLSYDEMVSENRIRLAQTTINQLLIILENSVQEVENLSNQLSDYLNKNKKPFSSQKFLNHRDYEKLSDNPNLVKYARSTLKFWSDNNKQYALIEDEPVVDIKRLKISK